MSWRARHHRLHGTSRRGAAPSRLQPRRGRQRASRDGADRTDQPGSDFLVEQLERAPDPLGCVVPQTNHSITCSTPTAAYSRSAAATVSGLPTIIARSTRAWRDSGDTLVAYTTRPSLVREISASSESAELATHAACK